MKERIRNFWLDPVNKFWVIPTSISISLLFFGFYRIIHTKGWNFISLIILITAIIYIINFLSAIVLNTSPRKPNRITQPLQELNQRIRYKRLTTNTDSLTQPEWDDSYFKKIKNQKERSYSFAIACIQIEQKDFNNWKITNIKNGLDHEHETFKRVIVVLISSTISAGILTKLGWIEYLSTENLKNIANASRLFINIPIALIGTLVAAPVVFSIWFLRDTNNRLQIENSRKDTNLKDFQKLSEWASGFHLPEIKKITSDKTTVKIPKENKDSPESINEHTTSLEDFIPPDTSSSISRRHGAEALQASAIAQLETFMFGKYGEQFMQPAFLLLHAIWESLITQKQNKFSGKNKLKLLYKSPIVLALNKALIGNSGWHLKLFNNQLEGINLSGLDSTKSSLRPILLSKTNLNGANLSFCTLIRASFIKSELSECNFKKADLRYSKFLFANLSGANFESANLQGANLQNISAHRVNFKKTNLKNARLQLADMIGSNFKNSNISEAELEEAFLQYSNLENSNLSWSNLIKADLSHAELVHANLEGTNLQHANLSEAKLLYCSLLGAKIDNTIFTNTLINQFTFFGKFESFKGWISDHEIREDVLSRGAIWDDDPEWLVGKIQNPALLEKIRQDCARRKGKNPDE